MSTGQLPGLTVERGLTARMRDGTLLAADVYRPTEPGPWPVIVMRLPYDKEQAQTGTYTHPAWYARHGYLVVVQDTRGRWASGGEFYPFRFEQDDGFDTVTWAARLPGSNGHVGMYGFSYAGATQLLAAVTRPEALRCICPALTGSQYYDGWAYNGGAFALAFNLSWATRLAMDTARRRGLPELERDLVEGFLGAPSCFRFMPLSEYPLLQRDGIAPYFFDWIAHPTYDEYWRAWSIDERYETIATPALHVAGWYDIFRDGTIKNFQGLRAGAATETARRGQKLVIGPWYHAPWAQGVGQVDFGPAANHTIDDIQLRWFDYWLAGKPNGMLEEPPVRAFVMGDNQWREYADWPPPGIDFIDLYLHSGGRANSLGGDGSLSREKPGDEPHDVYTYDPIFPVPSQGGHSCCNSAIAPMGPADQRTVEYTNGVLVYTSAPLETDLVVAGPVALDLWAASSAVDTDFTAKLVDVDLDGRALNVTEGILRARHRDSLASPTPLHPWEVYRFAIDLGHTCIRLRSGHQIRLEISSSNFPHWDRNTNSGNVPAVDTFQQFVVATQLIFHDGSRPSHLRFPVILE